MVVKKAVVLDQLTFRFCARFLPKFGDRTVDQMVQAARSGKQNIVEGLADDVTSSELAIKLLNVARASLKGVRFESVETFRRWRCHTQSATDSICAGGCRSRWWPLFDRWRGARHGAFWRVTRSALAGAILV